MTRGFFVRKGARLLLVMAILADLQRLSLRFVWQSPCCFALCCWKNACTCRGQHLTQSCETFSFMCNVTSVLPEFSISSLLIFPDIFVEFPFSLENEISIKSLPRKMLALWSMWLLPSALKCAEEKVANRSWIQ